MNRKRRITTIIILGLALVLAINIQPVQANSFSWGVLPAQQFEYSAHGNRQDIGIVDMDFSLTIVELETIPDSMTFPIDFPRTTVSLRNLEDSSSLDMGNDISSLCLPFYAMPIGDWDYISTVVEAYSDSIRDVVTFENATHWGYSDNGEWPDDRVLKTTIHLKETGMMEYHSSSHWSFSQQLMIEDVTIRRLSESTTTTSTTSTTSTTTTDTDGTTTETTPTGSGELMSTIVPVSVGAVAVIAVAGFIKFRGSKSSGRSAGEMGRVLVICPYCGAKTEQGVVQCSKCGANL